MVDRHLGRFGDRMRGALADRKTAVGPPMTGLTAASITAVALYIAAAIFLVPSDEVSEFNFSDERGAVTVLSALLLGAGSGFALVSFLVCPRSATRRRLFWFLVMLAIGFLAMDELLEFHERVGRRLDALDPLALVSTGTIRGWNDVVVILYGLVGLPAAIPFLPTIVRYPKVPELMAVAAAFYIAHTAIDSLVEPRTPTSIMIEESAKLYSSTFIALALLAGLLCNVRKTP